MHRQTFLHIIAYARPRALLRARRQDGLLVPLELAAEEQAEALWALLDTWLQFMIARPHAARIIARNSADLVSRTEGNPTLFSESAVSAFDEILRDGIAKGVFRDVKPALALNIIGSAIPAYVCNAEQLGKGRGYTADAPETLQSFREMLQAALRGILIA